MAAAQALGDRGQGGIAGVLPRQQVTGHRDRGQGAAQVVAEHGQEGVPGALALFGIGQHRFGQRLVDGFIEADHVGADQVVELGHPGQPQAQHGRAQRAVLGGQLQQRETADMAQRAMGAGGAADFHGLLAAGFLQLFARGFRLLHVLGDRQQDRARMVAQRRGGHLVRGRIERARERVPLREDRFHVLFDEGVQTHGGTPDTRPSSELDARRAVPLPTRRRRRLLDQPGSPPPADIGAAGVGAPQVGHRAVVAGS
jgi:hypothetical protein